MGCPIACPERSRRASPVLRDMETAALAGRVGRTLLSVAFDFDPDFDLAPKPRPSLFTHSV
jgi:hypothetical protein